jgi:AraC-like DNA-binding protein
MSDLLEQRWIAGAHALSLAELAARWGVSAADLLGPLGLDAEALVEPKARLPIPVFAKLCARAEALTGEPGLGFHLGLAMRVASHGYLGFAAMAAPTVRDALDLAARFAPTRTNAVALRVHESGGKASVVLDELGPLGEARELLVIAFLVGLRRMGAAITGARIEDSVDVAFPEPAYAARHGHVFDGRVRYGQPAHQLIFDASVLAMPLREADPVAVRLAREQCERELLALGHEARDKERVRAALPLAAGGFRSIEQAAAHLGMSARTLRRRLAEEGTSFSEILDEERRHRALLLLRARDTAIDAVAADLGYADVANFTRAFRRWTGTTPARYRAAGQGRMV